MSIDQGILAIKDKKEQDVQIMRMLSMNLWRRINAGYNVTRRKPESWYKTDFKDKPELKVTPDKEYNRKRDSFMEYAEAVCRFDQMVAKPRKPVPAHVPYAIRLEERKQRVEERKAQKLAGLLKVGAAKKEDTPTPKQAAK